MPEKTTASPWLLPYPTAAGEVKLGAVDIQELAERLTTLFVERNLGSIQLAAGAVYGARTARVVGTEYEPSATRPVLVVADVEPQPTSATGSGAKFIVGPVEVAEIFQQKTGSGVNSNARQSVTFIVPAGVKWKCVSVNQPATGLFSTYLLL